MVKKVIYILLTLLYFNGNIFSEEFCKDEYNDEYKGIKLILIPKQKKIVRGYDTIQLMVLIMNEERSKVILPKRLRHDSWNPIRILIKTGEWEKEIPSSKDWDWIGYGAIDKSDIRKKEYIELRQGYIYGCELKLDIGKYDVGELENGEIKIKAIMYGVIKKTELKKYENSDIFYGKVSSNEVTIKVVEHMTDEERKNNWNY